MKKIAIYTFVTLALCACSKSKESLAEPEKELTAVPSTPQPMAESAVETVDGQTSATAKHNEVSFNGTLVIPPQRLATVSLTMGGVVRSTNLLPGQLVQKGAVLATLDNPEFIALQQTWLESKAQVDYLRTEYERQKTLSAEQAASQKKFQQSKAEYLSMQSRLEASEAQLSLLGVSTTNLQKNGIQPFLQVKAPIGGYVGSVEMNIGKFIHPGDVLCEIIDKSQTLLKLTTYEKDLAHMNVGSSLEFRVNGLGNATFTATIISIGQRVDQTSRSLEVYAKVNDMNPQFRPGMYVTAQLKK